MLRRAGGGGHRGFSRAPLWRGAASCLLAALLASTSPAFAAAARTQNPLGPLIALAWLPAALLIFVALELVLWVLLPAPLLAVGRVIQRGRGRCLLIGALTLAIAVALLSASSRFPAIGQPLAPVLLGAVALASLTGLTAVTALLGQGALDLAERPGSRAVAVAAGSVLFGLVVLFPVVGQVLGLYFLLIGLGGALLALAGSSGRGK